MKDKTAVAKKLAALLGILLVGALGVVAGCTSDDADVASKNISKDADNFKIQRRIVFINTRTEKWIFQIEGLCSIEDEGHQLEVTCKVVDRPGEDDDEFVKHFLGLQGQEITYLAEQLKGVSVSVDHYKVTINPSTAVPDPQWR